MKRATSFVVFTVISLVTFSQSPQRLLERQSSNLKEPSEAAIVFYNKGLSYSNNKQYILANKNYQMAIAIDSDYIDALNNLGLNFYEMNLLDSAEYFLQLSLMKLPSGTTALQNIGLVEEKKGNLPKALECYKQIVVFDPNSPEGYYNMARVLITMGKLEEGLVQAQQAEKIYIQLNSPEIADCHYLIFVAYYNLQNIPLAKKYLALCKKEHVEVPTDMEQTLK